MRHRMELATFVTTLALFALRCQGLEFTMHRDALASHRSRATCRILLCVEESPTASHALSSQGNDTSSGTNTAVDTISSMTIYKTLPTSTSATGYSPLGREVASVTSQHPSVTRVSDGVKVDGQLTAGRATLRLELVKQEDCQADFTCQVQAVDGQGRQLVSTSHLLQQADEKWSAGGDGGWTPAVNIQLVDFVQQLDTKLALMGSTLENWEEKMNRLEDNMGDKIETLMKELSTKADRSEDKVEAMKNRLEDDIKYLENRLEDKIGDNLGTPTGRLQETVENEIEQQLVTLDNKVTSVKKDFKEFAEDMKQSMEEHLNKASQMCEKNGEQSSESPTPASTGQVYNDSGDLAQSLDDIAQSLGDRFANLQANIQAEFQDLSSNIGKSFTTGQALQSAIRKVLTPTTCHKGMVAVLPEASLPYTVIQPGAENGLDAPVLCDTFTDGGGWVVIQRRTKGDVNFYRGWEEYKAGFGSLDGDFWIGLERIHTISSSRVYELRVDLRYGGKPAFAHYGTFTVKDEGNNYALQLGPFYQGSAGDSLSEHNGQMFSTHDRDNDKWPKNCAISFVGAWWYNACHHSNLNGQWGAAESMGPRWNTFSSDNAVTFSEMKIRRVV